MIKEPKVKIGILTDGEPKFIIKGNFRCEESDYKTIFFPTDDNSRIIVTNSIIGKNFHWERNKEIELKGIITILPEGAECRLLNEIGVEDYLLSVLASEMNPDAPLEFLKAHAIISRSWIIGKIERTHPDTSEGKRHGIDEIVTWADTADHNEFDVCNDDHCQRYHGYMDVNDNVRRAVEMTRGVVLSDTLGCVIDSRFSKCCGGRTELFSTAWQDLGFSYLQPVEDSYCDLLRFDEEKRKYFKSILFKDFDKEDSDIYEWETTVSKKVISDNLRKRFHVDLGDVLSINELSRGASGRLYRVLVKGTKGSHIVGKELAIRKLLSESCLKSSAFTITDNGDDIILEGKGWGHGVGLCQTGAAVMASENKSCSEILSYYYPTTHLTKIYD